MVKTLIKNSNYWNTEIIHDTWVYISCPIMENASLSFAIKRKIVTQLKSIERAIQEYKLKGWIGYTKLTNPHIMAMYLKLKAIPYEINKAEQKIWFKKELS